MVIIHSFDLEHPFEKKIISNFSKSQGTGQERRDSE